MYTNNNILKKNLYIKISQLSKIFICLKLKYKTTKQKKVHYLIK